MPRYGRESNPEPFDSESRVQSNIPRHLALFSRPGVIQWLPDEEVAFFDQAVAFTNEVAEFYNDILVL